MARDVALRLGAAQQAQPGAVGRVGAGCSMSAGIPSAGQIVDDVRVKHPQACAAAKIRDYPSVMHQLPWPSRYALFHDLEQVAGLNWAHVGVQGPALARKVGLGDLYLAAALQKPSEAAGPRAGSQLLQQATVASARACQAAADYPPRDRRAKTAQALIRVARRAGPGPRSLRRVQTLRSRRRAATGL